MIFVTVGTSHFDALIEAMDNLVASEAVSDRVIAQIGDGNYIPKNLKYVRLLKNLDQAYDAADLIVSAGGAGTTMECATKGLKLVVVENESVMEGHQRQLIQELHRRGHLIWCRNLEELSSCIEQAMRSDFQPFVTDPPRAHKLILEIIKHENC